MGQAVRTEVDSSVGVALSGMWVRGESLQDLLATSDVLIDFSLPDANAEVCAAIAQHRIPLVCGVSGFDDSQSDTLQQLATGVAVVFDRNMSQGVAVLADLVVRAAQSLGDDFKAAIHEVHHVHKIDSPSGTALKLGEAIDVARPDDSRPVTYESERRGEVPGEHMVTFSSPTETLTLRHSVTTRQVFAQGALRAARWAVAQPPGLYQMRDVLFGPT